MKIILNLAKKIASRNLVSGADRKNELDKYELVVGELDRARRFSRPLSIIAFDFTDSIDNINVVNKGFPADTRNFELFRGAERTALYSVACPEHSIHGLADNKRVHDLVFHLSKPRPTLVFVCPETTEFAAHLAAERISGLVNNNQRPAGDQRYGVASFPSDGVSIRVLIEQATAQIKTREEHRATSTASSLDEEVLVGTGT